MVDELFVLGALRTVMAVLGFLVVLVSWRGYRRTKQPQFLRLAVGFGLLTLGVVLAGALFNLADVDIETALIAEAVVANVGLAVILWSVYG